jgi:hypothetical protein
MTRAGLFAVVSIFYAHLSMPALAAEREEDGNPPPPPSSDPSMKRVRSVPIAGQPSRPPVPKTERQEMPRENRQSSPDTRPIIIQGSGVVASESGFGVVRKPDGREYTTTQYPPRSIMLNGVDISAVRGETLENVTVRIDETGNLELRAPHYEVGADTSFHPLLPTELPRVPKGRTEPLNLPKGTFSKRDSEVPVLKSSAQPPKSKVEVLPVETKNSAPSESTQGRKLQINGDADEGFSEQGTSGTKATIPAR